MSWPFGDLVAIWYILPRFGILCREKSGNPASNRYLLMSLATLDGQIE
jgi:hypothetical protein